MSLSNQLVQYQMGMQALSGIGGGGYYGDRHEPIEKVLDRKKAETEQGLAARQQELADINAAIEAIADHPHVAKIINLLRKVGL